MRGIKSMYVDSSSCVRVKGDESERFRIDSGVKQSFIMSPLAPQCINECSDERAENEGGDHGSDISGEEREWKLPGFLYTSDLVLCGSWMKT